MTGGRRRHDLPGADRLRNVLDLARRIGRAACPHPPGQRDHDRHQDRGRAGVQQELEKRGISAEAASKLLGLFEEVAAGGTDSADRPITSAAAPAGAIGARGAAASSSKGPTERSPSSSAATRSSSDATKDARSSSKTVT